MNFNFHGAAQAKPKYLKLDGPPFTIELWTRIKNCYPYPFAEPFLEEIK